MKILLSLIRLIGLITILTWMASCTAQKHQMHDGYQWESCLHHLKINR